MVGRWCAWEVSRTAYTPEGMSTQSRTATSLCTGSPLQKPGLRWAAAAVVHSLPCRPECGLVGERRKQRPVSAPML